MNDAVFFFDNAKIHKAKILQKLLNCIPHMYNAPYSPCLNPIEEYFALLKYYYRKNKFMEECEGFLPADIYAASKKIKGKAIAGFALNSLECLKTCLLRRKV